MVQTIIDTIATTTAKIEALTHLDAIVLPNFPRSIQLEKYSCGAKAVYCILQYYDRQCTPDSIEEQLHTDEDGTSVSNIKRVLKRYGLTCRTLRKPGLRDLKAAIDDDCPVLISLYDSEHYAVVFGYSSNHIFVSNPSLNILTGYGRIRCGITKSEFRKIWDRWGVIVNG
jgi:ABC-type bacteriocin/lantibiotic exporter with double-glycine peptidase domain